MAMSTSEASHRMKRRREFEAHRHHKDNSVTTKKKTNGNKKNDFPVITEETLADARTAIEAGKESKSLENVELVEEVLEKLKGKSVRAASELLLTVALIIDPIRLHHHLKHLEGLCAVKALHYLANNMKPSDNNE